MSSFEVSTYDLQGISGGGSKICPVWPVIGLSIIPACFSWKQRETLMLLCVYLVGNASEREEQLCVVSLSFSMLQRNKISVMITAHMSPRLRITYEN